MISSLWVKPTLALVLFISVKRQTFMASATLCGYPVASNNPAFRSAATFFRNPLPSNRNEIQQLPSTSIIFIEFSFSITQFPRAFHTKRGMCGGRMCNVSSMPSIVSLFRVDKISSISRTIPPSVTSDRFNSASVC